MLFADFRELNTCEFLEMSFLCSTNCLLITLLSCVRMNGYSSSMMSPWCSLTRCACCREDHIDPDPDPYMNPLSIGTLCMSTQLTDKAYVMYVRL